MNDDQYRWQDHVPSSVNGSAYLAFGAVFAALLAMTGLQRAETAAALHLDALMSIKATKMFAHAPPPADDFSGLFVRHDVSAGASPCRVEPPGRPTNHAKT